MPPVLVLVMLVVSATVAVLVCMAVLGSGRTLHELERTAEDIVQRTRERIEAMRDDARDVRAERRDHTRQALRQLRELERREHLRER
jgi:hypothetical protein